jgi:hypothetical protein
MRASTKLLISETGGGKSEREREREREIWCVWGKLEDWYVRGRVKMRTVRVRSMVKDMKCEWEIDGMREDKKGNMNLMRE